MVIEQYREANELADLLDFYEDASRASTAKPGKYNSDIASLRADLAKRERIDGKPADPASERRGFTGAA